MYILKNLHMSEFSLSFVIRQWWFVRVFTFLPYCIQYYVIHLCVHVIGELCWFITVYNAKSMKVGYQQGRFLLVFFDERMLYEHTIASSEFWRCPSFYGFTLMAELFRLWWCNAISSGIYSHLYNMASHSI